MELKARKIQHFMTGIFVLSILLLTVPTLAVLFLTIHKNLFITLNTIGLILATFRIVLSLALSISVEAIKGESTSFKKKMDRETKVLFIATIVIQFINFMFIHFN